MSQTAKIAAGRKAAEWIENGMIVGLGTGSTAICFIQSLVERVQNGLRIRAVSSSQSSADLAKKGGIEIVDINTITHIDITVDGTDEIDSQKRMIKGAGGALVREKILANASHELVIVADPSKLVPSIGRGKLPIEVMCFGSSLVRTQIEALGFQGKWRHNEDNMIYVTENGNLIFDITFPFPPQFPEEVHDRIRAIPGVVDTGFFFDLAGRVIIGYPDGKVEVRP